MTYRTIGLAGLITAITSGVLAGAYWMWPENKELQLGVMPQKPQPLGEFRLVDQHKRLFTREGLEDRWSLVFMGFTHCPDVCPTTLTLLKGLDARLRNTGNELQMVFITVDPERDTPQVMAQYLKPFSPRFVGITGEKAEIDRLCGALKTGYVKNLGIGGEYSMDHSASLILIDPRARAVAYFKPPLDLDRLAADLSSMLR